MIIKCIAGGIFMENCYIIGDEETNEGMLVDPGEQVQDILEEIDNTGVKITKIVNTHCHLDHVAGVEIIKQKLGIPFYIHEKDKPVLDVLPEAKLRFPGFDFVEMPEVDGYIEEGETLKVGNLKGEILLVPGHTWGHVCFVFENNIIAGDTVFSGSVGRVDLTGGTSMEELIGSINQKIMTYPDDFNIFPGHGPSTTVGIEKRTNPFLQGGFF
ncbi:MAG: MBL fold metallo-hydrolase [Candidatus Dadabacteria bacterium]|nr:MBL fold metallo-hydrolase [Candidatus Dadabacteria bacterium]NIQ14083.1 MBL fold metallo-hydrolase [Candidatus Dadabacteria bacterium]